ncbi:MAG: hypothetical protein ACOYL6_02215 [Bacteriovoracaceae bacterium]
MLFTLENNSDIQTYFQKAQYLDLERYFNVTKVLTLDDFLKGKGNLSIHKFLLVDIHSLENVDLKKWKKSVTDFFGIAYFYKDAKSLKPELMKELATDNIVGIYDLSLPVEMNLPMARNLARYINADSDLITPDDLRELGDEINQILTKVEKEMIRVKKIHSHIMPKRAQHFKNIEVESKFATGEGSGGEFFDLFESGNKVLFFLSSSNSYLTSTITLGTFHEMKGKELTMKALESSLKDLESNFKTLQETKNKKVLTLEVLVGIINLKTMEFDGYNFGNNAVITNMKKSINTNNYTVDKGFLPEAQFHLKFERGESAAIVSSGLKKNCQDVIDGQGYLEYIQRGFTLHKGDLMNEVFFHLRKNMASEFLNHDATLVSFRIDANALVEV